VKDTWFSPGQIRFTVKTSRWLIENLHTLQLGTWPSDASNYTDLPGTPSGKAPFITPAEYYVEISSRLERCGIDGLILLAIDCWGESIEAMARYLRKETWVIRKRRKLALGYVASGPVRRWHDKYNKKGELKREAETYKDYKERVKKR